MGESRTKGRRLMFRVCAGVAMACALLFGSGCVYTRGGVSGIAADGETGQALGGVRVHHYIKRRSHWPFIHDKGEYSYKLLRMNSANTNPLGVFHFPRKWIFFIPFVQGVSEERVIVNLTMQTDLMMRSLQDARLTNYWIDPNFVEVLDPRYKGVVIDMENSLIGGRLSGVEYRQASPEDKFLRGSTDDRDLGAIRMPGRDAGVRVLGPGSPAAPGAGLGQTTAPAPMILAPPAPAGFSQPAPLADPMPTPIPGP